VRCRVYLERPSLRREREYLDAVRRSRSLHRGFVTAGTTADEYRQYLRRTRRDNQESFFVISNESGELVGVININQIVRHSQQSGQLGYYAFAPHAGKGLMREGMQLVLRAAFGRFGLHRLEANVQPRNARSAALLRSLGFGREGIAKRALKIGGRWLDHERWAILKEEWETESRAERRHLARAALKAPIDARNRAATPSCRSPCAAQRTNAPRSRPRSE
jgi:[ribosomal protein S5]-alanine N-acetyltransferase